MVDREALIHSRKYPLHYRTMGSNPSKDRVILYHMAVMCAEMIDREARTHSRNYPPGLQNNTPMESAQTARMGEVTTL